MTRRLLLFEDGRWRSLRPLTDTLPVAALAFGGSSLGERWARRIGLPLAGCAARPAAMACWADAPRADDARPDAGDEIVAVNAAALGGPWLDAALDGATPELFMAGDRVAAARLPFARVAPGLGRADDLASFLAGLGLPSRAVDARFVEWPWQLVEWNHAALSEDLADLRGGSRGAVDRLAALLDPDRIAIGDGARVGPYAVLDARDGPIRIGRNAQVAPHTVVVGPCVVGAETQLLGGVVGHSTIGPHCRIAGEVDACVWQGRANKRHHGFVGHSVIGEWVNLGALTTTSDLKNNYGSVRVWVDGTEVDSGASKVGSFIGAHAKTGIGTLLPTGGSVGVGANLFGGGRFAPKSVPSFGWWDGERMREHRLDEFLKTAGIAMSRRGQALEPEAERALRALFDATAGERRGMAPVTV